METRSDLALRQMILQLGFILLILTEGKFTDSVLTRRERRLQLLLTLENPHALLALRWWRTRSLNFTLH